MQRSVSNPPDALRPFSTAGTGQACAAPRKQITVPSEWEDWPRWQVQFEAASACEALQIPTSLCHVITVE